MSAVCVCVGCCRLGAVTAGEMWSGSRTVYFSSAAIRGGSSPPCSRERVLVPVLLCECAPAGEH